MKRLVIVLVAVAAVGGAGWWAWQHFASAAPAAAPAPATADVRRGEIVLTVEATGSVESNLDVEIKSKASGTAVKLPYDVSDRVPRHSPGRNDEQALLVALDPVDEQRNVQRSTAQRDAAGARLEKAQQELKIGGEQLSAARARVQAESAAAKARADLAQLTLDRLRKLLGRAGAAQDEVDTAAAGLQVAQAQVQLAQAGQEDLKAMETTIELRKAEVDLARANLAAAEADLAEANRRLEETRIHSPIDGLVTSRNVSIGQIIASGILNVGGGTPLMTVSDLSKVFVQAVVDESDIGRLVETGGIGQEAAITADAYPGRRFTGRVERITPRGVSEAKVVSFLVKIEVTGGGKDLLLPRMTANVSITANQKSGVLLAPNSAVQYDKDQAWVSVFRGGRFVRQDVKLGLNDGLQAEVMEGLDEGDKVLLSAGLRTRWSNDGRSDGGDAPASRPTTAGSRG